MERTDRDLLVSRMPLGVLCAEAGVGCPPSAAHIPIYGVCADSRRIRQGELFIAIKGFRENAAEHLEEAVHRGCAAVVCEDGPRIPFTGNVPVLYVPDGRVAMAYLFDAWYGHPARKLRLIGVTGTNGKTTVSVMIHRILTSVGIPCGLIGTVGCLLPDGTTPDMPLSDERVHMTTPDPPELYALLSAMVARGGGSSRGERPVVVMEVTSHALALGKVEPLHFDLAVLTNISRDHLDHHGSMEAYAKAKYRLFNQTRVGVVNGDDPYGRRLLLQETEVGSFLICHPTKPSFKAPCDRPCERVYAEQIIDKGMDGVSYRLTSPRVGVRIRCPVPGAFTVENSLLSAAVTLAMGVGATDVRTALGDFGGVPGRMERVSLPPQIPYTVFIDFAHTPDALERLLQTARGMQRRGGRVVVLFGCGGDRDRGKRGMMGRVAVTLADRVIITSDNSRCEDPHRIMQDIVSGIPPGYVYEVIADRADAIRHAVQSAEAGDIILLCGKGHETYEVDSGGVHPFCEKEIVQNAVTERHGKPKA